MSPNYAQRLNSGPVHHQMGREITETESKSGVERRVGYYSGDEDDALLRGDLLGPPLDGLGRRLDADPRHRHRHLKSKHCLLEPDILTFYR